MNVRELNVRELIAELQKLPDQDMRTTVMHACSGMDAALPVGKVRVVRSNAESDAMWRDDPDSDFPRVEITAGD
jgi:hypothetical protein